MAAPEQKSVLMNEVLTMLATRTSFSLWAILFAVVMAAVGARQALEGTIRDIAVFGAFLYVLIAPFWMQSGPTSTLHILTQSNTIQVETELSLPENGP